jgi:hypothetical protein
MTFITFLILIYFFILFLINLFFFNLLKILLIDLYRFYKIKNVLSKISFKEPLALIFLKYLSLKTKSKLKLNSNDFFIKDILIFINYYKIFLNNLKNKTFLNNIYFSKLLEQQYKL